MEEEYNTVWVLKNLWRPNCMFNPRIKIPDTVYGDPVNGYVWLFTSQQGQLKKKSNEKCNPETILKNFMEPILIDNSVLGTEKKIYEQGLHVANFLQSNTFTGLSYYELESKLIQGLAKSEAIQKLLMHKKKQISLLNCIMSKRNGHKVFRYSKKTNLQSKINIIANKIINQLQIQTDLIINTVEGNSQMKIQRISINFIEDEFQSYVFYNIDDFKCSEQLLITPSTSFQLPGIQTQRRFKSPNSPLVQKRFCQGDYCNIYIKTEYNLGNQLNYDEILQQVRTANLVQNSTEVNKFKLGLATDLLQSQQEKQRGKKVDNQVSFRLIKIGRIIQLQYGINNSSNQLQQIDLRAILSKINLTQINNQVNKRINAYDKVMVCHNCYDIYELIRQFLVKSTSRKQSTLTSKQNSLKYLKASMTPTPELNTERTHQDYFHSPLGYIAKNNLNDLMADIQYAKLEYKGKSSIEKIREYHQKNTQFARAQSQLKQKKEICYVVPLNKSNLNSQAQLAEFFPNETQQLWKTKGLRQSARQQYVNYIKNLRKK